MARTIAISKRTLGTALLGFSFSVGLLHSACSSGPTVRKDREINLSNYRTYQWVSQEHVEELHLLDPKINYLASTVRVTRNEADEERIKAIVDESLRKQGFGPSGGAPPDFYVTYYKQAKNEDWVSTWSGFTTSIDDVPVVIFPDYSRAGARGYREGVAYLTIYDAETQKPAWTGNLTASTFQEPLEGRELSASVDLLTESLKESA